MKQAFHIQDQNFAKIKELDQSLVNHVNTLLENEITHDQDIRTIFHLLKAVGYFLDITNNRAISYNLRSNQGKSIANELTSLERELSILKDTLHHTMQCTFNQCIISQHLSKVNNTTFLLTEQIKRHSLKTHYQILCQPASDKKISSLHLEIGHKIDPHNLILSSGKRIQIQSLANKTLVNKELQFI